VTETIGRIGPGGSVDDTTEWAEPNMERAVCPECGTQLERSVQGGPHPWQRLPEPPQYET